MITVTSLRSGTYFTFGKDLFQVLSYEHIKLGRGTANIKLKTKNLKTGAITEKSFISGAKVEEAVLERREAQFLYKTQNFFFMDPKTFEQFELNGDKIESAPFLKEGMMVKILFYKDEPLTIELPIKMGFIVAETGPGIRGDSATNIFKDAILENGLKIKVPLFVKVGDQVLVDTRTRQYQERVTKDAISP
ncbi:MAG: elongation factor P [Microgenomates group bacterium LiPW_16]|nr:MAG: elongation factor P [Microgenomates group bacterium LiPW_16]